MEQITIPMYKIISSDGKWLTQAVLNEGTKRAFVEGVYTGHPDQWIEWTDEQKQQWEIEHPIEDPEDIEIQYP